MSHDERGSTGTTIIFLLLGLVLGAALGYWYASRERRVEPPPAPAPKVRQVTVGLEKNKLVYDHPAIYLSVDRKDRIVWSSATVKKFSVQLVYDKAVEERVQPPPPNPFEEGKPAESAVWSTENGRIELGPALPAARGHQYHFVLSVGGATADPHIIFETGG